MAILLCIFVRIVKKNKNCGEKYNEIFNKIVGNVCPFIDYEFKYSGSR